jgi:hypothetical protein
MITFAPFAIYALAALPTYLLKVYTLLSSLPDVHTSFPVPGRSLRPLSEAELGETPSLCRNSITTMSLALSRGVMVEKRPSFV